MSGTKNQGRTAGGQEGADEFMLSRMREGLQMRGMPRGCIILNVAGDGEFVGL